jgi:hypothetical protein
VGVQVVGVGVTWPPGGLSGCWGQLCETVLAQCQHNGPVSITSPLPSNPNALWGGDN